MVFRGLSAINLDPKGRMAMPARYRDQIQEKANGRMIATIDPEVHCLLLYPLSDWIEIERKLEQLPSFNPLARRIQRLLIGHATELELDNLGRMLIPNLLREYAELTKKGMLVGQGKKFELWDEVKWQQGRAAWLAEGPLQRASELPQEMQSFSL